MAEIQNPIALAFRVSEAAWREESWVDFKKKVKAIPLREIFADDLERTLWLAIKHRHLTNQHFHHAVREAAASCRRNRPADSRDMHSRIEYLVGRHFGHTEYGKEQPPDLFCEELLRYVLAVLDNSEPRLEFIEKEAVDA